VLAKPGVEVGLGDADDLSDPANRQALADPALDRAEAAADDISHLSQGQPGMLGLCSSLVHTP
jgi:hypothetical protein